MSSKECNIHSVGVFDEDVENNYNEDRIPDVLNPYLEDSWQPHSLLIKQTSTPELSMKATALTPRNRAKAHMKHKKFLSLDVSKMLIQGVETKAES
jgi:hypothetical protein